MKNTIKIIGFVLCSLILNISCQDDDKRIFDDHLEADDVVPYVRIILDNGTVDSSSLSTEVIKGTVSAPGNNVTSWKVQARITGSMTTEFADITTISSFPSEFSVSVSDIATSLGVDLADIMPADEIEFSASSTRADGFTLTADQLANDLSGQPEQRQAYDFSVIVFCAPVAGDASGDWILNLADSYGDGWDGAFLTATIDGVGTKYTFAGGFTADFTVNVPAGSSLVFSYTSGAFEGEHSFTMTKPDGSTVGPLNGGGDGIPFCFL